MNGVHHTEHAQKEEEEELVSDVHDVFTAKSLSEIRTALARLQEQETNLTMHLNSQISAQKDVQRDLGRLDLFRAGLSTQAAKVRSISNSILTDAASTASRISSSVKRIDVEKSRVQETLTIVEQVRELKSCILGVSGSMGPSQDWETAAGHLNRAFKIPDNVVDSSFAARVVPTAEVPDAPRVTLENASEALCSLFLRDFDKAVKENDGSKITRLFKMFPLINRSDVGLDVYGRYVCQGVATKARANLNNGAGGTQARDGFFYANALTKLFEHIAQIVDGHGGLVEQHYGPKKMTRVIERLQNEADTQGGILLDTWSDERKINRLMTDIKSYAYTFLVQSFLPPQKGLSGTPRSGSPGPGRNSEDEGVDMKEVDALLAEMALMLSKWSLYVRFIAQKCKASEEQPEASIPSFLIHSSLMKKIEDRLIIPFNTMTAFFFRRSVEKAFQLDESPPDLTLNPRQPLRNTPPHVSSAIEDVMYIISKVLQQTLATSQKPVVTSVIPTIARVMGSDFLGLEQRKMRDEHYPRPVIQGGLPPESTIVAFIVLINNIDTASSYVKQIIGTHIEQGSQLPLAHLFPMSLDQKIVHGTLLSFNTTFSEKANELLQDGTHVLFNNVMKPRLRPIILDSFRDIEYNLDAGSLGILVESLGYDAQDMSGFAGLVSSRFAHGWDALTKPISRLMTESTYSSLLITTVTFLSKLLEKRLWTYAGRIDQPGAARLEHDVNGIVKVVVSQGQKTSWKLREVFLRCLQICMVMNMDSEEWEELEKEGNATDITDKLKPEERRRAREMLLPEQ